MSTPGMTRVLLSTTHNPDHWFHVELGEGRPTARVNIIATDEGIVVDVWRDDDTATEPVASTYAFDADLEGEDA